MSVACPKATPARVADNVIGRRLWVLLTQPLADGQVAPPGFLIVSRTAVVAFGTSEYALRLFPLLCSLASLALFARIAARVLRGPGAVLAMALFALSPGIALYAAETKQYSSDILVALATDTAERERLIAKGYERVKLFSWEKTVAATLEVYRELS